MITRAFAAERPFAIGRAWCSADGFVSVEISVLRFSTGAALTAHRKSANR